MEKYKITPRDGKVFGTLFKEFGMGKDMMIFLQTCRVTEVIVTPEINHWLVVINPIKDSDEKFLKSAEFFLSQKYDADIEIKPLILQSFETPAVKKRTDDSSQKDLVPRVERKIESNGDKLFGRKINGEVIDIL